MLARRTVALRVVFPVPGRRGAKCPAWRALLPDWSAHPTGGPSVNAGHRQMQQGSVQPKRLPGWALSLE